MNCSSFSRTVSSPAGSVGSPSPVPRPPPPLFGGGVVQRRRTDAASSPPAHRPLARVRHVPIVAPSPPGTPARRGIVAAVHLRFNRWWSPVHRTATAGRQRDDVDPSGTMGGVSVAAWLASLPLPEPPAAVELRASCERDLDRSVDDVLACGPCAPRRGPAAARVPEEPAGRPAAVRAQRPRPVPRRRAGRRRRRGAARHGARPVRRAPADRRPGAGAGRRPDLDADRGGRLVLAGGARRAWTWSRRRRCSSRSPPRSRTSWAGHRSRLGAAGRVPCVAGARRRGLRVLRGRRRRARWRGTTDRPGVLVEVKSGRVAVVAPGRGLPVRVAGGAARRRRAGRRRSLVPRRRPDRAARDARRARGSGTPPGRRRAAVGRAARR